MDGLSRAGGVGATIKLGDRTLSVSPRFLRHYAEMEAEVRKLRGNPFDQIREAKDLLKDDPDLMRQFVEAAFIEAKKNKIVTLADIQEFTEDTWSGGCFVIWLAVRDNDRATLTLEKVTELFSDEFEVRLRRDGEAAAAKWRKEIEGVINSAGGDDEVGNSTGSLPSAKATAESANPSTGT